MNYLSYTSRHFIRETGVWFPPLLLNFQSLCFVLNISNICCKNLWVLEFNMYLLWCLNNHWFQGQILTAPHGGLFRNYNWRFTLELHILNFHLNTHWQWSQDGNSKYPCCSCSASAQSVPLPKSTAHDIVVMIGYRYMAAWTRNRGSRQRCQSGHRTTGAIRMFSGAILAFSAISI